MKKPDNLITLKKLKELLLQGTSVQMEHGEFLKLLLVDGSALFTEEEFLDSILYSSALIGFMNGNLRKNSDWGYAISNAAKKLSRKNSESEDNLLHSFSYAYEHVILKKITAETEELEEQYYSGICSRLKLLTVGANVYYTELQNELSDWPNGYRQIPDILALLTVLAIFQDNICLICPGKYHTRCAEQDFFPFHPAVDSTDTAAAAADERFPANTAALFLAALAGNSELGTVTEVHMTFHSGYNWRSNDEYADILKTMLERNINLKVIVNLQETMADLRAHLAHPLREYTGFDQSPQSWFRLAEEYPDLIQIHAAHVPLMHRTYTLMGRNKAVWTYIHYYSYGYFHNKKNLRIFLRSAENQEELQEYEQEFSYLWNHASTDFRELPVRFPE